MKENEEIPLKRPVRHAGIPHIGVEEIKSGHIDARRAFIFFSYVPEWWAKAIVWITGGQLPDKSDAWSHMGIGFDMAEGSAVYFEAIVEKGFSGPKPIEKLVKKINSSGGRLKVEYLTDLNADGVAWLYDRCEKWVGVKTYSKWQLVRMWFFERFGRRIGLHVRKTPDKLVCSEAVARLIYYYGYDLTDAIRPRFDEVNPNSAFRKWLKTKKEAV